SMPPTSYLRPMRTTISSCLRLFSRETSGSSLLAGEGTHSGSGNNFRWREWWITTPHVRLPGRGALDGLRAEIGVYGPMAAFAVRKGLIQFEVLQGSRGRPSTCKGRGRELRR